MTQLQLFVVLPIDDLDLTALLLGKLSLALLFRLQRFVLLLELVLQCCRVDL